MIGTIQQLRIFDYKGEQYLPPHYYEAGLEHYPVIYLNGGEDVPEMIAELESHFGVDCREFLLLNICPHQWTNDYSPWPAPPIMGEKELFIDL